MIKDVKLETKTSKTGNPYQVLVIIFKNGYEKTVFLDKSEIYMLQMLAQENK